MKRSLPVAVSAIAGIILLGDYFLNIPVLKAAAGEVQDWGIILAAFALAPCGHKPCQAPPTAPGTQRQRKYPQYDSAGSPFCNSFFRDRNGNRLESVRLYFPINVYTSCGCVLLNDCISPGFSILQGFPDEKTHKPLPFLFPEFLLMLGRAPVGEVMWSGFPRIADWIMGVVNLAGSRGILISTAIGMVGVALRVLSGIDRSHLGSGME
jgi:hypothetical protein